MILADYHVHTNFSDGKQSPEEMVRSAIAKGMTAIGFTDHSYVAFDEACGLPLDRITAYQDTVRTLKEKYAGKIRILLGIEQDFFSETTTEGYDYVIGSVHYVHLNGQYIAVDDTPEILQKAAEEYFDGDYFPIVESYYRTVSQVVEKTHADIIGHVDLIQKFNENGRMFDDRDPRYIRASQQAMDILLKTGKPFEINTGAIFRGYRSVPYPLPALARYLRDKGAQFLLSSDSHTAEALCFSFETFAAYPDL